MLGTTYVSDCFHVDKPWGLSTFAYLHQLFPLVGPEGLGVQSSGNQAAGWETQCLPSLQDLAKEKLILGSLGHHADSSITAPGSVVAPSHWIKTNNNFPEGFKTFLSQATNVDTKITEKVQILGYHGLTLCRTVINGSLPSSATWFKGKA